MRAFTRSTSHFVGIGASAKRAPRASNDDCPDRIVSNYRVERIRKGFEQIVA
jgi:hypothetical protein